MAFLPAFISPLIDLRNSSYEISPDPSLSKTLKALLIYAALNPIRKSCIALANSSESRDLELLSSAILNFLPIPEIPLAPLAAILFLTCSISYISLAFKSSASSFGASCFGLLKILLSPLALGWAALSLHPFVPWPYLDSSSSFQALLIILKKYMSSSIEQEMLL